jgi:hypothetical protein
MIELEVNGRSERVEPGPIAALCERIERAVPDGHVLCSLWVDGAELSLEELRGLDPLGVRRVRITSAHPRDLARGALPEAIDFVARLRRALRMLASRYRDGAEAVARGELVEIADALHVLVPLLSGIRRHLEMSPAVEARVAPSWSGAESELARGVDDLLAAFESGDPVALADASGFALPRALGTFSALLKGLRA